MFIHINTHKPKEFRVMFALRRMTLWHHTYGMPVIVCTKVLQSESESDSESELWCQSKDRADRLEAEVNRLRAALGVEGSAAQVCACMHAYAYLKHELQRSSDVCFLCVLIRYVLLVCAYQMCASCVCLSDVCFLCVLIDY